MDVLEKALDRVRLWPEARRIEAAELLLALDELGPDAVVVDDDATLAAIDEALSQLERGERADNSEIEAIVARYRT